MKTRTAQGSTSSPGESGVIFMNLAVQSSSHFDGSLTAILHAHRRGVSAQYVNRSVYVGMVAVTTMLTDERRLALAALSVDGPARRTGLRCVHGRHLNQAAAPFLKFVGKDSLERVPALVQNGSIKARLLTDIRSRRVHSTGAARRHACDLQVFHDNGAEALGNAKGGLVVPVAADSSSFGGQSGDALNGFQPSLGALLAPCDDALSGSNFCIESFHSDREGKHLAVRKRQAVHDTPINANAGVNPLWDCDVDLAGDGNVPTDGIKRDGGVFYCPGDFTSIAKLDPAKLRYFNARPASVERPDSDLRPPKSETFVHALSAGRRVVCTSREKAAECLIQITQGLNLSSSRNVRDPIKFRSQLGKLSALGREADVTPLCSFELPPEVSALLKREIVNQPAYPSITTKRSLLFGGRAKPETIGAEDHLRNLA